MSLPVTVQLAQAGWFFVLGAALGLCWDLAGGLRDGLGLPGAVTDPLLLVPAGLLLFAGGMASAEGRLRLYMLLCAGAGWGLWARGISPVTRPM